MQKILKSSLCLLFILNIAIGSEASLGEANTSAENIQKAKIECFRDPQSGVVLSNQLDVEKENELRQLCMKMFSDPWVMRYFGPLARGVNYSDPKQLEELEKRLKENAPRTTNRIIEQLVEARKLGYPRYYIQVGSEFAGFVFINKPHFDDTQEFRDMIAQSGLSLLDFGKMFGYPFMMIDRPFQNQKNGGIVLKMFQELVLPAHNLKRIYVTAAPENLPSLALIQGMAKGLTLTDIGGANGKRHFFIELKKSSTLPRSKL